ncbi:MAG: hypothetical protein JW797_15690 [Bradymonadales bacterium]|nr:hypothetical protein [Bradymonadales bacterium]
MTYLHRANRAAALIGSLVVLWCSTAWSQVRLVIPDVENDDQGRLAARITEYFDGRAEYLVIGYQWIAEELSNAGLSIQAFLDDPQLMRDLSLSAGFDILLAAQLDRPRRARQLEITVYEGASGAPLGSATIELDRGRINEESFDWGMAEVESHILQAEVAQQPPPEEPPEPPPTTQSQEPYEVARPRPATVRPPVTEWLFFGFGIDAVKRNMSVVAEQGGIDYVSGFFTGFEGTLELFPLRLFRVGPALAGLGLRFRLARHTTDTALVRDPPAEDLIIPTRNKELGLVVVYRYPLGPFELGGLVGYQGQSFVLGANDLYSSSQYDGIALGLLARYHILGNLLDTGIEFEVRPAPQLGNPELLAFGGGASFGFNLQAEVGVNFLNRFRALAFYTFRQYRTSFDGGGSSDLVGAIDTTDTYHLLGLRLHLVY